MNSALSLRAAETASSAVVLFARHTDLPGIKVAMDIGAQILGLSLASVSLTPPRAVLRTVRAPVAKVVEAKPRLILVKPKATVVEREDHETRSAWEPSSPQESSRCKALLLEVLRRAAHDWVLYRSHRRLLNRECAQDAYHWLFEEDETHLSARERAQAIFSLDDEGEVTGARTITSFLSICEILDLDPETVRARVRQMDVHTIMSAGRPAETRKLKHGDGAVNIEECGVMINVDMNAMPNDHHYETQYESYGIVSTPDVLNMGYLSGGY